MLTFSRSGGRSSENTSIRSTSRTMRSVSSQMSRVSARSSSPDRALEQLRRAPNARQRVLDLVREHRGEPRNRARRAPMGQLPVYFIGNRPFLQHDQHPAVAVRQRGAMHIDAPVAVDARPAEVDAIFVDRGAALAHLLDQRHQRRAERQQAVELLADQYRLADLEERLGRGIGVDDHAVAPDRQNDAGQRLEDAGAVVLGDDSQARPERRRKAPRRLCGLDSAVMSPPRTSRRRTGAGPASQWMVSSQAPPHAAPPPRTAARAGASPPPARRRADERRSPTDRRSLRPAHDRHRPQDACAHDAARRSRPSA